MSSDKLRVLRETNEPIDEVVAHYKSEGHKERNRRMVGASCQASGGQYFYSPIDEARALLERMREEKRMPRYGLFVDAGSGDARIVALATALNVGAVGIEKNPDLYLFGQANINALASRQIIDEELAVMLAGDFADEQVYSDGGIRFSAVGTVYHHSVLGPHKGLAARVSDKSEPGTKLVLVNMAARGRAIHGMKLEKSEKLRERPIPLYVHIYGKRRK